MNGPAENFQQVSNEIELMQEMKKTESRTITEKVWIPVDNYFNVKSVGTVVLSVIKGGSIKKYDKLMIQPMAKEVIIKGIQSQDRDIDAASAGMRVGLNLKGIEDDEIKRGSVICSDSIVKKNVNIEYSKNKYSKEMIETGSQLFLSVGLQVIAGKIDSVSANELTISLEQPAVYFSGQKCLLASTKQVMPRIIGSGIIK